jgi:AraC-like DNA-binding protein
MDSLPRHIYIKENVGSKISGSFIDPEWVLHYIAQGRWDFIIGDRKYEVQEGDMVFIPPHLLHIVLPERRFGTLQYVMLFDFPGYQFPADLPYVITLPKSERGRVIQLFHSLKKELRKQNESNEMLSAGLLVTMIGVYLQWARCRRESRQMEVQGWENVQQAIRFMRDHHAESDLSLDQICKASGLTKHYFCGLFKKRMGCTPMGFLKNHRLQQAEELLMRSTFNCTEIAEKVGFSSIHRFSRSFRRERRYSPSEFRQRHAPQL